jgi:hypothetical protein
MSPTTPELATFQNPESTKMSKVWMGVRGENLHQKNRQFVGE